ncbi:MAG: DegV family protein [Oscillospiraceae bacterium]|jgi:DegV family protein with EDD domain|nr:DegV family protein [Oscillospiraceae bacterium]
MEKIAFFSDSPCDLLPEDYKGKPYRIIPSSLVYADGHTIKETEVDRAEYYKYLKTCKEIPTTAMGTPEQWAEGFEWAFENGFTHAVIMTISSTASSVAQSIGIAKEIFLANHPDGMVFELIDSRGYSLIYGRLLLDAFEMNDQGKGFGEIVAYLKDAVRRSQGVVCAYSLDCMRKSGRVSGMAAFVGGALGIRPVLLAFDGKIAPIEKVRGEKNLIPRVVEHVKSRAVNPQEQDMIILYGDIPAEEIDLLEKTVKEQLNPRSIWRHSIGVTVVTNCGPETLAVLYFGAPADE